jgi:hypothetical protein
LAESELNEAEAKKKAYQNQLREQIEAAKRKKEDEKRREREEQEEEERKFLRDREIMEKKHQEQLVFLASKIF